jgi:uncharacterized protein (DUF486 family)
MSNIFTSAAFWQTAGLLFLSNCFMTYAWYGHLKSLGSKPLLIAVVVSWGIAFFEYLIQVPANRIGHAGNINLAQLKIMQEVIALSVFVPFSVQVGGTVIFASAKRCPVAGIISFIVALHTVQNLDVYPSASQVGFTV